MEKQNSNHVPDFDYAQVVRESAPIFVRFTQRLDPSRDAEQLLRTLPSALHELLGANSFLVFRLDAAERICELFADVGSSLVSGIPSVCEWVHEHQQPVLIASVKEDQRFADTRNYFAAGGDKSLYILPLRTSLRRVGVLCAECSSENAFSDEGIALLTLAADHAALAVDNRLNYAAREDARAQLAAEQTRLKLLLDLNNSMASNLDLKRLIRAVSPGIRNIMKIDAVALVLPSPSNGHLEIHAMDFPDSKGWIQPGVMVSPDGSLGRVFRTGKPWVGDLSQEASYDTGHKAALQEGLRAVCLLPLVRCDRVLGVLSVARLRKDSFPARDIEFLLQIAGQVAIAIDNVVAYRRISELTDKLTQEKLCLEDEIRSELNFEEIVGNSAVLRRVLGQVQAVAPTDSTVLIYGETGSGKELIARAVHKLSLRRSHPFVKLNCAAIPTGLLESELFGHEKGAFTSAIAQRIGRFELASQGTIFLDEVGEIPLELQPKLLRVLQEREFERLGSSRTLRSDARLIAATNRDLQEMVDGQRFRSDLFYRLNVFPIHMPPLRERREDIPFLVRHFTRHYARLMKKEIDTVSSETMKALMHYSWPGNIRELQNVIERAVILSTGTELKVPAADLKARGAEDCGRDEEQLTLREIERRHILSVLQQTNWVFSGPNGAAARLGMKRPTLQFRMRKLGISRPAHP